MGNKISYIIMNQGYGLVVDAGLYNANPRMGPAEREEMYRADLIDAVIDERLKRDKKKRKDDEMY